MFTAEISEAEELEVRFAHAMAGMAEVEIMQNFTYEMHPDVVLPEEFRAVVQNLYD
jgi:hypothetical protein